MLSKHIVWDWNGTLLDDLHVVIEAANVSLGLFDIEGIDEDGYRDHFTRPVRASEPLTARSRVASSSIWIP